MAGTAERRKRGLRGPAIFSAPLSAFLFEHVRNRAAKTVPEETSAFDFSRAIVSSDESRSCRAKKNRPPCGAGRAASNSVKRFRR